MKGKARYLSFGAVTILAALSFVCIAELRSRAKRLACENQMGAICAAMQLYIVDHGGHLPPSLDAMSDYVQPITMFECPATRVGIDRTTNISALSGYIYCFWPTGLERTPADYPLLYDRRMSNHDGRGINVFLVGAAGALRPQPVNSHFWDKNAQWLRAFVKTHPEQSVPLPED